MADSTDVLRLHIGGQQVKPGWKILNIQPGPGVDFVGDCIELSQFADASVGEIYASHVYEHLGYQQDLPRALREAYRVLKADGVLRISVPDLDVLCRMFAHPQLQPQDRFQVMRMMFGGQMDAHDFHRTGLTAEFMGHFLGQAGFRQMERVQTFALFDDTSSMQVGGVYISLNVVARK